ncbi:MAG: ornithine carbamoyltransferase [Candidatus Omnitrophota bacterium]
MKTKDLITIDDLTARDIFDIMKLAKKLKKAPLSKKDVLKNKTLALLFQKPSNRTRVSFEVAMVHLGGHVLYLSPNEIDMGTREPVKDVARVISRYVDAVVARVFAHQDVVDFAYHSHVPVINGLSDFAHPCQALSDMFTVMERFKRLKKVTLAYVGDGNNVLNSLLIAGAKIGLNMKIAVPEGYGPSSEVFCSASQIAKKNRVSLEKFNNPREAVKGADVVYTDVWISMGQESEKEKRLKDFKDFQINKQLMREAKPDALIMHCLPAHRGQEITDVIDGKNSIVYDQAENRMHVQKAILLKLINP